MTCWKKTVILLVRELCSQQEKFWGLEPLLAARFMRQKGNDFIYSTVNLYH